MFVKHSRDQEIFTVVSARVAPAEEGPPLRRRVPWPLCSPQPRWATSLQVCRKFSRHRLSWRGQEGTELGY